MNEIATQYRNRIVNGVYSRVLKPILFSHDPELVHDRMTAVGKLLGHHHLGQSLTRALFGYENSALEQNVLGIQFKNPTGLSAGFDKNAELIDILPSVGFGFAEIGSITGEKCAGNPKPRLWRLPESQSLAVYYGLKNDGCEAIAEKLRNKKSTIPLGVSIAMTNCKDNLILANGINDFSKAFRVMEAVGDYTTVNISCPNTEGGQPFIDPQRLDALFDVLDTIPTRKPIFMKFSPDMQRAELEAILSVARAHRIQGIIATNLTKKRDNPRIIDASVPDAGGLSGKVVEDLANSMLSYIYKKEGKRFTLIGSGGVFTAEDAYKKIRLGASLVQIITGMIFKGPQVISEINQGLVALLKRDGFKNISDAIGVDSR